MKVAVLVCPCARDRRWGHQREPEECRRCAVRGSAAWALQPGSQAGLVLTTWLHELETESALLCCPRNELP